MHSVASADLARAELRTRKASDQNAKRRFRAFLAFTPHGSLTLTRFETRVAFADDKNFAATTYDFAVTMSRFGRLERVEYFHDTSV
jgi:hypothetical protein